MRHLHNVLFVTLACTFGKHFIVETGGGKTYLVETEDRPTHLVIKETPNQSQSNIGLQNQPQVGPEGNDYAALPPLPLDEKLDCSRGGDVNATEPCILPWKFKMTEQTNYGCISAGGVNEYWCSTKVDEEGYHVSGHWNSCTRECVQALGGVYVDPWAKSCPAVSGEKCVFPLTVDGFSYYGCLQKEGHGKHGFCNVADSGQAPKLVDCSAECPQEYMLKDSPDLSVEEILNVLIREHNVRTRINWNPEETCTNLLETKFQNRSLELLPEPAKSSTNFLDALNEVCAGSNYCANSDFDACGDYEIKKRMTVDSAESTVADCWISCAYPPS